MLSFLNLSRHLFKLQTWLSAQNIHDRHKCEATCKMQPCLSGNLGLPFLHRVVVQRPIDVHRSQGCPVDASLIEQILGV